MNKIILSITASLLLIGCGGNPSGPVENNEENGGNNKEITIENEPLINEQWALMYNKNFYDNYYIEKDANIHMEKTIKKYTGKGIKIAVLDMGIDNRHIELDQNVKKIINARDGSTNIECTNKDVCYHGTAVTGIIGAELNGKGLVGIARNVEILFVNITLDAYVSDSEILDALIYAQKEKVRIINASWGTGNISPIIEDKINEMAEEGTIFVFAAGNDSSDIGRDEASLESVIAVGSSNEENKRSEYSSYGSSLDILAPGGYMLGITTTYPHNEVNHQSDYITAEEAIRFRGTSAAAPIVTGVIALMLEKNKYLTKKDIIRIFKETSDKIGDMEYIDKRNDYYGYGKINVDRIMDNI